MVPNHGEIFHCSGGSFIDRRTTAALLIQWQEEAAPPARKGTASFQSYMKLKQDAKLPPRISSKLLAHADHDCGKAKKIQGHHH